MTRPASGDDGATGPPWAPLAVADVDRLLAAVAGVIHDRPVQGLVAGKLLVEGILAGGEAGAMGERGLRALDRAAEQARDIMWALLRDPVGGAPLAVVLHEVLGRHQHEDGLQVEVALPATAPSWAVTTMVHACHDVAADAVLRGGVVRRVALTSTEDRDAVMLTASVTTAHPARRTGAPPVGDGSDRPWLVLAAARLAGAGGRLVVTGDAPDPGTGQQVRVVRLDLPAG